MQAHHTTCGWLAVEWHLGGWWQIVAKLICALLFCNAYSSLPGNNHCPLPGDVYGSLPGNICQCPAWERSLVPCLGTLASVHGLPGHACSPCLGRLPVPCLGTLASALPGHVLQSLPGMLPVPCLGTFANALPGHVCQSLPGTLASSLPWNAICWDAVPCRALFLCLSDKHEMRASAPLQVWNATHPCALLFCYAINVKWRECKAKEKRTNTNQWRSGWLCENERTKKGEWREGWFAVVDSRSK